MMLTALIEWRPIEEVPDSTELFSALLAWEDDEGNVYLEPTLYDWHDGAWYDEIDNRPNTTARWWVPERELTQPITLALAMARQRDRIAEVAHGC